MLSLEREWLYFNSLSPLLPISQDNLVVVARTKQNETQVCNA